MTCQGSRTSAAVPALPPPSHHVILSSARRGDDGSREPVQEESPVIARAKVKTSAETLR
jgi:hypothetical protein